MHPDYRSVIGLEIHAQLAAHSKVFCADPVAFAGRPNTRVSPVSLGHPGTLPTLNLECLRLAIKMGLATGCNIAPRAYFARKNYFYPDLPKGYQISQDTTPICTDGFLDIRLKDGGTHHIRIQRIHMEEDAGKSIHDQDPFESLIDLNRASVGLIEIVSHPDIENADQAMAYLTEIRKIVRYLGICDGNMEEGSLRCDANVSVMRKTATEFGTRTETKNMNSISNVGRAINYEIDRQIAILEAGGRIQQETRTWDPSGVPGGQTLPLRDKENAHDYRYFPEPDLQPVTVNEALLTSIRAEMPPLPEVLYRRFVTEYGLPAHDATLLTEQREYADYFLAVLAAGAPPRAASNWLNGSVKTYLNAQAVDITDFPISAPHLAAMIALVETGQVSHNSAKEQLFKLMLDTPHEQPEALAATHNLLMVTDETGISAQIDEILKAHPEELKTYLGGKTGLMGFFVGQVMKASAGKADPKRINELLRAALEARKN